MATDSGHNSKNQTRSGLPKCDSRPVVSAELAHHDRVESPPRSRESDIQTVGNSRSGHVCHSPQHASSPVHAGEVNVHISTVSPAQQSHSEAQDHPDRRGDTHRHLVAVTTVVSTPATTECGSPTILSVPQRPVVTTVLYLKWQVIPAPTCRRPSTNRMYDDRWLRFTNWATGRGFDPLGPTAAQITTFLYELFDTHPCRHRLSRVTGSV